MELIHILEDNVINQIAAGEVVERPASVVKELVENALDAGATHVEVDFDRGGTGLIKVADNGVGMSTQDARIAVARHSTSKIRVVGDLESVATFGFRGEALASIASVSRFEMVTRRGGDESACRLLIGVKGKPDVREAARPAGTTVSVAGLFHNTPARLKFLKKNTTETERALKVVMTYALAFPHVGFLMRVDGRTTFDASSGVFANRLASVYGRDVAAQMTQFERHEGSLTLTGALSMPGLHKPTRDGIYFFVNRRWVTNPALGHALLTGYHTLLPSKRYPVAAIFIEIPGVDVDVNVHPTKREVKFRNDREAYDAVVRAVRGAIMDAANSTMSSILPPNGSVADPPGIPARELFSSQESRGNPLPASLKPPNPYEVLRAMGNRVSDGFTDLADPNARVLDPEVPLYHFAQMFNTFIVFQSDSELFIADQHTVHERLNYERLMEGMKKGGFEIQPLLVPLTLELDPRQSAVVKDNLEVLQGLGIEIEPFGGSTFALRAVPADVAGKDPEKLLRDLVDELTSEEGKWTGPKRLERFRERVLTFLACRSSVMAGDRLNEQQMKGLIQRMQEARLPFTCPHGRPTILAIPLTELYRKFERH
jgi:DNA mismatch repair protein MutL